MRVIKFVCALLFSVQVLAQNVGIGTSSPQSSALLEVSSNSKGFLPPRMTFQEIKNIANPVAGLTVYDTEFRCLRVFDGVSWQSMQTVEKNLNDPPGDFVARNTGQGDITPYMVKFDPQGNIIIAGYFFSQITVDGVTLNSAGQSDAFLFKFNAAGKLLWYKNFGGTGDDQCAGLAVDAAGNIVIAGIFRSTSINIGGTVLTNVQPGSGDLFVAKLDGAGNLLWANAAGGNGEEFALAVGVDPNGNVYVTGFSASDLWTYGPNLIFGSPGDRNIILAKYNASGVVQWARAAGGAGEERGQRLVLDAGGNCYITGFFTSAIVNFGGSVAMVNSGGQDFYLAKYDASGNPLWVKTASGPGNDWGYGIDLDPSGNVIVGGIFTGASFIFQGTTLTNSSPGLADAFLMQCDPSGSNLWLRSFKGANQDYIYSVSTDAAGSIYVGGFTSSPDLDLNGANLSLVGASSDAYFAKFASNGACLWGRIGGGRFEDGINSVAVSSNGTRICAVGEYSPQAKFGANLFTTGSFLVWIYGE